MSSVEPVSKTELKNHHCFEDVDRVPRDPETTAFKHRARLQQALWRESNAFPIGSQPMQPKEGHPSRPLGSRLDLAFARDTGANFLNDQIRIVARRRLANPQPHQTLDDDRLYCDLLSSMPMCFNLFGALQSDLALADDAVHSWWPAVPGRVRNVLLEWSPGRLLPGQFLENRSAFDVAFELELEDGTLGVLGIETKYHEDCRKEKVPKADRRKRYAAVSEASGIIAPDAVESILGTDLQQIWLDHLLALSIPQHPSGKWSWAGFVLVHPERNPSYARATERYRALLADDSSMQVSTLESLLTADVLPGDLGATFSERYLW